jgi:hypothetical protein
MADKNKEIMRRLAEAAATRRRNAQFQKSLLDSGVNNDSSFRAMTRFPGNARAGYSGEFLVGPLRGGEARTYSRAKGAVARKKKK